MNLYFLLEGRRTEPALYRRWLQHAFPALTEVAHADEMVGCSYRLKSAAGYPQIIRRIEASIDEIRQAEVPLHGFFICLDAEDQTYQQRYEEIDRLVQRSSPSFRSIVIVQNCCIETWLLGNQQLVRPQARTAELRALRDFYDVREKDPESLPRNQAFATRAAFHLSYLKMILRDLNQERRNQPIRYTKNHVGIAGSCDFLEALVRRHEDTRHIQSFGHLVTAWRDLGAAI